jgi:hypothetical protein
MGTTQKTTQANTYDPGSMNTFSGLTSALGSILPGFMNNPFGTQQFKMGQQLGNSQAQNLNQTATSGLVNNMIGSGMAGGASNPAATEMLQNQARQGTNTQANLGFIQPTQNALQMQQNALGTAAGYKPLQTGGTNTQSTGGLGTWLPQLAGAALGGLASGGLTGGIPGMAPGMSAGDTSVNSGALGNAGAGTPGGMPPGMAGLGTPAPQPSYGSGWFTGGSAGSGSNPATPWFGGGSGSGFGG